MNQKKILIIEDDLDIRESMSELLKEEDYFVLEAENGKVGLELLKSLNENRPDLILLDLSMPVMGGNEFLTIQKNDPAIKDVPVAVLTAAGGTSKPPLADDFLRKPVNLDHLFRVIEKWVGKKK